MTKQLQECINSGQVSAAQVVAHAEAGELALCPICGEGRVTTHMEAAALIFKRCDTCHSEFAGATESRINKRLAALTAALEAEREKVRILTFAAKSVIERLSRLTPAELDVCPQLGIHLLHAALTATQEQKS